MYNSETDSGWFDLVFPLRVTTALIFLVIMLVMFTVTKRWLFFDNRLPGPINIPIIGGLYVIFFNPTNLISTLTKLSRIYGDAYSLQMGSVPAIVVCGYAKAKEVLVDRGHVFSDRPLLGYMKEHPEQLGIFFQNGERWNYLRKLTHRCIRDLNVASVDNLRMRVAQEMKEFVHYVNAKQGRPFNPKEVLNVVAVNTICSAIFNQRFDYDNKRIKKVMHGVNRLFDIEGYGQMEHFIPILKYLRYLGIGNSYSEEIVRIRKELKDFILLKNQETHLSREDGDVINSISDAFRKRVNGNKDDIDDILSLCMHDLIAGGAGAASAGLTWVTAYTTRFQEVQTRCQKELAQVFCGNPVDPLTREDKLPYCAATLHEILRISSVIPTTAPHMACEDTTLDGCKVDEGTLVLVNLHSVHMEKAYWGDPEVFRPERFLDDEGNFKKDNHFLSFGAGPRMCLGRILAKKLLFQFFVTLLYNFDLHVPEGHSAPSTKGVHRISYEPLPFQICALPRTGHI